MGVSQRGRREQRRCRRPTERNLLYYDGRKFGYRKSISLGSRILLGEVVFLNTHVR